MGLIMLILIGTVPTAYALNHAGDYRQVQNFIAVSEKAERTLKKYASQSAFQSSAQQVAQSTQQNSWTPPEQMSLEKVVSDRKVQSDTPALLSRLIEDVKTQVAGYKTLVAIPAVQSRNVRNQMYVASETLRIMEKPKLPCSTLPMPLLS